MQLAAVIRIAFRAAAAAVVVAACQNDRAAEGGGRPPPSAVAASDAAAAPPARAGAAADAAAPADAGAVAAEAPGLGSWLENPSYAFRLDEIRRCGTPPPRAATDGGVARADRPWLGFVVRVKAKVDEIFVSPRDVSLERGGIILDAKYIDQAPLPNCAPLLPQKQLKAGGMAKGIVLFELAPSFQSSPAPITLAYRPTRWGGAPRVEVKLRPCLDACGNVSPEAAPRKQR